MLYKRATFLYKPVQLSLSECIITRVLYNTHCSLIVRVSAALTAALSLVGLISDNGGRPPVLNLPGPNNNFNTR